MKKISDRNGEGDRMRNRKVLTQVIAAGMSVFLFGCSAAFVPVDNGSESQTGSGKTEEAETESVDNFEKEPAYDPLSEAEQMEIRDELETFDPDHSYQNMDPEKAAACGGDISDDYKFLGRETEDGYGYVLGFRRGSDDPLKDLSIYSIDDVIEAEKWNENENIFEIVYTFKNVCEMYYTESKDILFFVPTGMEEPEELRKAFEYSLCGGDEGVRYLESVKVRGVRMSPPEDGGYLAVRRFVDADVLEEYVPLTMDQEKEIIHSDEIVEPETYGIDGIVYTPSPEIYESEDPDVDEITVPALRFAEERCEFQTVGTEEMKEIASAKLEMIPGHGTLAGYSETGDSVDLGMMRISETLDDPVLLKRMEEILSDAAPGDAGKCPYNGILMLTKADGTQVTVRLASDGCDSMVYGSYSFYQAAGGEVAEIWDMFPEMKKEIAQLYIEKE